MRKLEKDERKGKKMASQLRLKEGEQERVRKKCIEINKLLVKSDKSPLKDSELIHIIIDLGLDMVEINRNGEVVLKEK